MHYRRQSMIRAARQLPANQSAVDRFDRIVAASSLFANIVLGIGVISLSVVGLRLTSDFNIWQKKDAVESSRWQKERAAAESAQSRQQACVQIAVSALWNIASNNKERVSAAIDTVMNADPVCKPFGVYVRNLTSLLAGKSAKSLSPETVRTLVRRLPVVPPTPTSDRVKPRVQGDRFFLGESQIPGFDIRGLGPKVERVPIEKIDSMIESSSGHLVEAGPRLSIGNGVSWNSPFGPMRIDIAKALSPEQGDQPKTFSFDTGTQF
jgi:hypothetical protein